MIMMKARGRIILLLLALSPHVINAWDCDGCLAGIETTFKVAASSEEISLQVDYLGEQYCEQLPTAQEEMGM